MAWTFSKRSITNLAGVHPDLVRVMMAALASSPLDFGILEGLRTEERQKELVAEGKSWTMNSRHLTGKAVDYVVYVGGHGVTPDGDKEAYQTVANVFKQVANGLGIPLDWGGDWHASPDFDHIELNRVAYPDKPATPLVA